MVTNGIYGGVYLICLREFGLFTLEWNLLRIMSMKIFLFRISRVISIICFYLIFFMLLETFNKSNSTIEWLTWNIFSCVMFLIVPFIFNWFCFGSLSIWIKKEQLWSIHHCFSFTLRCNFKHFIKLFNSHLFLTIINLNDISF